MVFYERFLQLCEENKVKPTPLMKELDLSASNVARWKTGGSVTADILICIAEYFDVSIDYLLGITDVKLPFKYTKDILANNELKIDDVEYFVLEKFRELPISERIKVAASMVE